MMEKVSNATKFQYKNIIGAFLFLLTDTRPDLAYAVGVLSKFSKTKNYRECKAALRLSMWKSYFVRVH